MHSLLITSIILPLALAHTRFTTLHINGVSQGDGNCIRQDQNTGTTTNYVDNSITGPDMACGTDGEIPAQDTCSLSAGDTISLEHRMWPDASQPGAIDVSHKGNTAIYMKKVNSMNDAAQGSGWFKIYWDGYDSSSTLWGTDKMNNADGMVSTTIPADLAPGQYLVRSEVLALQVVGSPQMYIGCAQVDVAGTGTAIPADATSIPGYIDMSTSAMSVNIYEGFDFQEYGPKLYGTGASTAVGAKPNGNITPQGQPDKQSTEPANGGSSSQNQSGSNVAPASGQCRPVAPTDDSTANPSGSNWSKWNNNQARREHRSFL